MNNKTHIYVIHGYMAYAKSHWFPWLQEQFANTEVEVHVFNMPTTLHPKSEKWLDYLRNNVTELNENTLFIGHSLGCITSLKYIAEKNQKIKGVILVSGFITTSPIPKLQRFLDEPVDCEAIKRLVKHRLVITAKDDDIVPWEYTEEMALKLDADLIVMDTGKHFLDRDGCVELPILVSEITKLL